MQTQQPPPSQEKRYKLVVKGPNGETTEMIITETQRQALLQEQPGNIIELIEIKDPQDSPQ